MSLTVKIYSDYVCPYCILAEPIVKEVATKYNLNVEHMPFELRPYPTPTLKPEGEYMQKDWAARVFPLAEKLGVKMVMPPFSPQPYTHLAFEGYQFAKERGKGEEYNSRMYKAFFQDSLNIGEIDVLVELANEIGLNKEEFRDALDKRKYKDKHQEALAHARKLGIHAAPTFIIGSTVIKGMPSVEQLERAVEKELGEQKQDIYGLSCDMDGCS
ncbi:MAG: DsbA family oxidoreductase [Bacillaceae bacterium]|nr:DsbA family oxidoreductase [Bacillaceae bacterium]